ncbi:hypothetical protein PPUJ13061_24290 [Pseudomonas putida]|uniref:Uncharacterized protein n=1 Tax=Pseudomonas putida NBRC 14164 TaxID=1211579 RepID=A0ABN5UP47_PSEPU|nr:hypothetical protein PP4_37350 [Pseudomonas putida NBRC 14164]GLO02531.1 hypothetical protein PPUJ13061_24290 [Pseudomonas putida]GLO08261.1 hypothetical protein PPUJ20005_22300 [Pseudomonas putida]GLO24100.1 hypothetical protein PPUJ21368_19280 [Pseudomonas putida]
MRLAFGIASNTQTGGMFADFGAHLALETGPAMHEQGIHLSLHYGWRATGAGRAAIIKEVRNLRHAPPVQKRVRGRKPV